MIKVSTAAIAFCLLGAMPIAASAQSSGSHSAGISASEGDREFSVSGTGNSDRNLDSGSFGVTGDLGWYVGDRSVAGIRQSVNYASIEGESLRDDFWNGASRAYLNYHFLDDRSRPFVGASLGGIYGDGVKNSSFAGLEAGLKYYVIPQTYILGRVDYQFLFSSTSDASDAFQDSGIWAYTVGLGYNF